MRSVLVLAVMAVLLVALPPPAAAPHIGGTRLDPVIAMFGCQAGVTGVCTYSVETFNRTLIFFRFDLDADGRWDLPDQTGGGTLGRWTTLTVVSRQHLQPSRGACAEAWDGVTTRIENGQVVVRGPRACTVFLDLIPDRWDRNSRGFVWARLDMPSWLSPSDFDPRRAEVEGLRALPWPFQDRFGERGPREFVFRVDRSELTALLGPGNHAVHLTLPWAGVTFTSLDFVTIS